RPSGSRAGRTGPASGRASRARRAGRAAAAGTRTRAPPTATPRRTATCRSPRRTACACAARARARPATGRSSQYGEEVERAVERARRQTEVALRDRRREAVVERLGDAERLVDLIPGEVPDRQLVQAQLARVEEAEQL